MPEPVLAGRAPMVENLAAGTYEWCACGRSKTQPFCDGAHKGSGIRPVVFTVETARRCALCMCKQTHNQPMCDGTHKTLPHP